MAIENISFGGPQTLTSENEGVLETLSFGGVVVLTEDPNSFLIQIEQIPNDIEKFITGLKHDISTDGIIPVNNLFAEDISDLGIAVFLGLEADYGIEAGTLKQSQRRVLVAGERFGKGSSREQAVWALLEAGIAAIIAPSFGPIFERNAAYSGLLTSTNLDLASPIHEGTPVSLTQFTKDKDPLLQQIIRSGGLFRYLKNVKEGEIQEPLIRKEKIAGRGMNIYEQRLANAFGVEQIIPGDVGLLPIDLVYTYPPLSGPTQDIIRREYEMSDPIALAKQTVFFEDHFLPESHRPRVPLLNKKQRGFAQELEIPVENYYLGTHFENAGNGICHRVMLERLDPRIYQIVGATDSHTPTIGALPILAIPLGSTLAAAAIAEAKIPYSAGRTMRVELYGSLPAGLSIRDAQLELAATVESKSGISIIEFGGNGLNTLTFEQVAALCNMVPEVFNAEIAVTEVFEAGVKHLQDHLGISREDAIKLYGYPEENCEYDEVINYDLTNVVPWIALPGNPNSGVSLKQLQKHPNIDKAYLVSCTLGLEDLEQAAAVLKNKRVASNTQLVVVPSSQTVKINAQKKGILKILEKAGATVISESICYTCIGEGPEAIQEGEVGITASNRNFPGRMGSKLGRVFMGGPRLVSLVSILGRIPTAQEYKEHLPRIIENHNQMKQL